MRYFSKPLSLTASLNILMGGFYFQWKYPNTSRKLSRLLVVFLLVYVPVYFLFIAPPKQTIETKNLQEVGGVINHISINESLSECYAMITLKEYPEIKFTFDQVGKTYADLNTIQKSDTVVILASTKAITTKDKVIPGFDLKKGDIAFFSVEEYNSGVKKDKTSGLLSRFY
jgi:VanZ family protein